jgi:hypothetical protein
MLVMLLMVIDILAVSQVWKLRGRLNKMKPWERYKELQPLTEEQKAKPSGDYSKGVPLAALTGTLEGLVSGAESFANGYTLGGYDWLNRKLGRNPQDLRDKLQQRAESVGWGGANTAGQIASGLGGGLRGLSKLTGAAGEVALGSKYWGLPAMALSGSLDSLIQSSFDNDFSNPMQTAIDTAQGGAIGAGMGGLGNVALKPLAKYTSSNAMTKGLKGGLDNVADNPQALRLVNDAVRRNNDIAELYLEATPGALNKVNADTSTLINKALTRKINVPKTIGSQKRKYGKFMEEHGQDQLLNPLSPKKQAEKNFKNWFKGSQVVDEAGEPLGVYHGTNAKFDEFNPINSMTKSEAIGNYFSRNKDIAETYGDNINAYYLNMKNPLRVDYEGRYFNEPIIFDGKVFGKQTGDSATSVPSLTEISKFAKNNGYDGVIAKNIKDVADSSKFLGKPDEDYINSLLKLSDDDLYNKLNSLSPSKETASSFYKRMGKKEGRKYAAGLIEQTEREMANANKLLSDDYIVFNPDQIKSVKNTGGWSKSPSLTDPDWVAEPSVADLFDGLNGFQKKSLASAIKQGSERTNSKLGSLESLNEAKKKLNDMIGQAYKDGNKSDVLHLEGIKNRLDNTLGKGLKVRDRPYAKALQMEEAYNKGWEYNPNNVKLKEYTDNLNPLERNAFAQGLFGRMTYNPLMSKNLAKKAMDYDNTLQTVLPKKTYGELQKGLSKQNTRFERLSRLGKRAETRLQTPEGSRLFLREQLEETTPQKIGLPALGAMLDEALYRGHKNALNKAARNLLDPTFEGVKDAWLIENYPTLNAYISGALANE